MKKKISKKRIMFASMAGSILSLQLGAFSVTLQTLASNITELPFLAFLAAMQPIHLAIGCVEGMITAVVLVFIYETRPELLWNYKKSDKKENRLSYKQIIGVFAALAIVIGGLLSLIASANPDGLEWSMERVAGTQELETEGGIYAVTKHIQSITSFFPDYTWKQSESITGTIFSGIFGGIVVIIVCTVLCLMLKFFRKKQGRNERKHE